MNAPAAEPITAIFKLRLQDDVHQLAAVEILAGKPVDVAVRHARAQQLVVRWVARAVQGDLFGGEVKL